MGRSYVPTPKTISQKYRENRRRRMKKARRRAERQILLERLSLLEQRVEAQSSVLFPEPDFDDGWIELESGGRLEWLPDTPKRVVSRVDVLRKTGADSFQPVPDTRQEGDGVWWREHPTVTGGKLIYNITRDSVIVRVQGWYAA